jgi:hypothetical protein
MAYTIEQQRENRKKWVEALRSGKYNQGQSSLNVKNRFCCLGVLCEVVGVDKQRNESTGQTLYGKALNGSICPEEAMCAVGLTSEYGNFDSNNSLVKLNDSEGASFKEIADIIESEPNNLFIN